MLIRWIFYKEDDGGGGGAPTTDEEEVAAPLSSERPKPSELLTRYGKDGDAALRMAERLSEELEKGYQTREKNRKLREELATVRGKAAPEGAVVLSADEAKQWEAYQKLGKPEVVSAALTERDATRDELQTLRRGESIRAAADAHGWRAAVLGKLPSLAGKDIFTKDAQEDGKPVKRAFVKDGDKEMGLPDYIETHDPEFLAALPVELPAPQGTAYVQQSSGGKALAPKNLVDEHIERQETKRKAQTNPLLARQR